MGSLSVKIGANTADLEKNIDRAKKILEKYSQTAHKAKSEIEQNVSVSNQQANAYQRVVKQLEKVNSGTLSTTQQQKVLTNQVKELKIQWNALTDDQKISGFGQSIAQSLKAAESELETTKQKIAAVSDQTEKTSSTTSKFDSALGTLSKTFGALGLAVGAAEAAQKLFNTAINSSQGLTDTFNYSVGTLNSTLGELAYAVFNVDFSYLNQGLSTVVQNAWAAQAAADQLFNTALSFSVVQSDAMAQIARSREIITDPNSTKEQIDAAKKSYLDALDDLRVGANQMANKTMDDINATIKNKGGKGTETLKSLGQKLKIDASTSVDSIRKDLARGRNESLKSVKEVVIYEAEMAKKYGKDWKNTFTLLEKLSDDQLKDVVQKYNTVMGIERSISLEERKYNKLLSGDSKGNKGTTSGGYKAPKVKDKTLIQQLEESNKKLQEEYDYRVKNYNKLSELVQKQKELNDQIAKQKALELLNTKALDKKTLAQAGGAKVVKSASEGIKDVNKDIKNLSKDLDKSLQPQIKNISRDWKEAQKDTKTQQEVIKSLGQTAGVMGQAFSEAFGQASGAAKAFIAVERVMLVAEQAIATAGAIKLAVESSTHWIEAIAASATLVAQVVSMFSTISKFEGGGIVNSASKTGDRNIIRVNGDEMILNQRQQAHLFKMLDDPYVSHTPNISYMQPEVKIKGSDIYLSQKNYKAITGRKI